MVLFTRKSRFAPTHVLLAGVALTTMSQSIIALATANGGAYAFLLRSLTLGSTYLISPGIALAVALCALATAAAAALGTRWLDILPLGNSVSDALGIDSRHARGALLVVASIATAGATIVVGPLSFVGLIVRKSTRLNVSHYCAYRMPHS